MVYTLSFFSSKCSLFHNSNVFGSCIIQILYTGCAKIKKNNSGAIRLSRCQCVPEGEICKFDERYRAAGGTKGKKIRELSNFLTAVMYTGWRKSRWTLEAMCIYRSVRWLVSHPMYFVRKWQNSAVTCLFCG
jgi:hypothetical protein